MEWTSLAPRSREHTHRCDDLARRGGDLVGGIAEAFKGRRNPDPEGEATHFRYFSYEPGKEARLDEKEVIDLLHQAFEEANHVHILAFPELALTRDDLGREIN